MKKLLFLLFLIPTAQAADVNGYTALYECRAGGPNCNVDVATLTAQACQQTITTATTPTGDWSAINWSNNVICIQAGDHTGRGKLTIGSSGTSGARKVLRYYRSGDTDDEPWNQGSNRAKVYSLKFSGVEYWIIHRISFDNSAEKFAQIEVDNSSSHIILNRILMENYVNAFTNDGIALNGSQQWLQNSVVRDCVPHTNASLAGVAMNHDTYVVNNELYNCTMNVWMGESGFGQSNIVVENNDSYLTTNYYYDGSGNQSSSGNYSAAENGVIATKTGGTSSSPFQIIHNRAWGMRSCDTHVACDGGGTDGAIIAPGNGASSTNDYYLIKDNIIVDGEMGIGSYMDGGIGSFAHHSYIGNIIYHTRAYDGSAESGIWLAGVTPDAGEVYLNTFIDMTMPWINLSGITNLDLRCNVVIDAQMATNISGSGSQKDYNVYYGTTDSGETNKLGNYTLNTRVNSTSYSLGAIIRTVATAPADGTSGDFLYKVTVAGTSASSPPSYTTTLGGTTVDGSMTVRAIRGPYSFYRKLRTGAELVYIPYAKVHTSAPDYHFCPSGFASRTGIGIDDTQP